MAHCHILSKLQEFKNGTLWLSFRWFVCTCAVGALVGLAIQRVISLVTQVFTQVTQVVTQDKALEKLLFRVKEHNS